jgi:hypothetical protein
MRKFSADCLVIMGFCLVAFGLSELFNRATAQVPTSKAPEYLIVNPDPNCIMTQTQYNAANVAKAQQTRAGGRMAPQNPATGKLPHGQLYYVDSNGDLMRAKLEPGVYVDDVKDHANPVVRFAK